MWQSFKFIWPLFICQCLAMASITQMIFSSTLVSRNIVAESWATLPVALVPVGTVMGVLPMTRLMGRIGRRPVLVAALLLLSLSGFCFAYAISKHHYILICLASVAMGFSMAAISQLRFAAMEMVPEELRIGAASMVLFGGIVAALIGPELGFLSRDYFSVDFVGSYTALAILALLALPFVWVAPSSSISSHENPKAGSAIKLLYRPDFVVAVGAGVVGYGVMSFVMTATPISMHEHFNHSVEHTKWVIQSHIVSMFLPSLFSTWLVRMLGLQNMMKLGLLAFIASIVIAFSGQSLLNFWLALVLLGVGWNFLYVGGTVMLPQTHDHEDRFRAQGLNDSIVFGVQATLSLGAGVLLSLLGWQWMLLICLPVVALQFRLLARV